MTYISNGFFLIAFLSVLTSWSAHAEDLLLLSQNSAEKAALTASEISKSKTEPLVSNTPQSLELQSQTNTASSPSQIPSNANVSNTPLSAQAQEKVSQEAALFPKEGSIIEKPLSVTNSTPAKKLFGSVKAPADMHPKAIGFYAKGCLAGAKTIATDGPSWQAMRLSRNRTWGHPQLIALLERYANEVSAKDGWSGLLIGDISQPRGGPMLTGHASHQVGLDADIWFTPMPTRRLSWTERENLAATSMLSPNSLSVNPKVWGDGQVKIVRRVASYPEVERVLVHPAIKKALCQAAGSDRAWLAKVRPYWGHFYHYHVRIGCPADSPGCQKQAPISGDDGCGKELDHWYKLLTAPSPPKDVSPTKPVKPKPPMLLADLPSECRLVLNETEDVKISSKPSKKDLSKPALGVNAKTTPNTTEEASN